MSKSTIYFEACNQVAGFQQMGEEFTRKLVINGKSRSTHENYLRQMSKLSIYYNRTPLEIETDELEEYLGHVDIRTTLIYLYIAQLDPVRKFGCMESLCINAEQNTWEGILKLVRIVERNVLHIIVAG